MKQWLSAVLIGLGLTSSSHAALNVMAIGDSMTEEYRFEFIFSAPKTSPDTGLPSILGDANTKNWVEILAEGRSNYLDFGDYKSNLLSYLDWRDGGYQYNFGIPGADTNRWMQILDPITNLFDSDFVLENALMDPPTIAAMRDLYGEMDVVVIFVGGNDVNFQYGVLYNATPGDAKAEAFITNAINNLKTLIDEIRDHNSTLPIVLANVPDLGATPDIIGDHPDATKRANATAIIENLNSAVANLATNRGATLAPITALTDRILSPEPFYIGALEMIKDKDPENNNRPRYLFCWQKGLHPSTNGQAMIANTLLAAINTATGSSIPLLPDREILTELLGLNPDQPFLDWADTKGLTDLRMTADSDGDGIPSLGEYLLNLDPLVANKVHIAKVQDILTVPTLTLDYAPDVAAARLADIIIKQSGNLVDWDDIPAANVINMGDGSYQARMPLGAGPGFFRMEFQLKP